MTEQHNRETIDANGASDAELPQEKYSDASYIPVGNEQPNYIYSPNHSYAASTDTKDKKANSFTMSMVLICLICALLAFLLGVSSTLLFSEKFDNDTETLSILPAENTETESESSAGYVSGRASMGIGFGTVSSSAAQYFDIVEGAMVQVVKPGSCADTVGLQMGDIITAVDQTVISDTNSLRNVIATHNAGDTVSVTIFRNREYLTVELTFDEAQPVNGAASGEPSGEIDNSAGTASNEIAAD